EHRPDDGPRDPEGCAGRRRARGTSFWVHATSGTWRARVLGDRRRAPILSAMAWSVWTTLAAAGVLISLTPGAGAVNTMANSIGVGWARSIWGILGQQLA